MGCKCSIFILIAVLISILWFRRAVSFHKTVLVGLPMSRVLKKKKHIVSFVCVSHRVSQRQGTKVVEIVNTEDIVNVELSAIDAMQTLNLRNLRVTQV